MQELDVAIKNSGELCNLDNVVCLVRLGPHMKFPPYTDGKMGEGDFGDEARELFWSTTGLCCTACGKAEADAGDGYWTRAEAEALDFGAHAAEKHGGGKWTSWCTFLECEKHDL